MAGWLEDPFLAVVKVAGVDVVAVNSGAVLDLWAFFFSFCVAALTFLATFFFAALDSLAPDSSSLFSVVSDGGTGSGDSVFRELVG